MNAATARRIEDEARTIALLKCTADATVDGARVEVDVDVLGFDEEEAIASVAGGLHAPFARPRSGEVWIGAILGSGLSEVYALMPLMHFDEDQPSLPASVAQWTPPAGEGIRIETRGAGAQIVTADDLELDAGRTLTAGVGGVKLEITPGGKIKLGSSTADAISMLSQTIDFLHKVCLTLTSTQTVTLLGPQPILTAPVFSGYLTALVALKQLIAQIKAV